MSSLGKPKGYFSLADSDRNVGSFFSCEDLYEILDIDLISSEEFRTRLIESGLADSNGFADENKIYKQLETVKNLYSSQKHKRGISFDEYVLYHILKRALPDAEIYQQVFVPHLSKKSPVDFYIKNDGHELYLEFDGTSHFAKVGKYDVRDSREKKAKVEDATGIKCVCWPFWMQRCEKNVNALFDPTVQGAGALWSTKVLFGSFCIDNPSELIIQESERFNAIRPNGIGYFYGYDENGDRNMPKHDIIEKILKGKKDIHTIIPPDVKDNFEFWLPKVLWPMIKK